MSRWNILEAVFQSNFMSSFRLSNILTVHLRFHGVGEIEGVPLVARDGGLLPRLTGAFCSFTSHSAGDVFKPNKNKNRIELVGVSADLCHLLVLASHLLGSSSNQTKQEQ